MLLIAIVMSIVVLSLETVDSFDFGRSKEVLFYAKWFFCILFTIEYLLRIYCVKNSWKYIFSFWGIVDLLSFLPDYFLLLMPGSNRHGFAAIRSLRLLRAFRIFNLGWIQVEADDLGTAIWRARAKVLVFLSVVMILVTVTGTLMYEIESAGNYSQFHSIPDGIYWAIVTMTTVGFGDIVPVTIAGKFLSAILILVGYSLIIVPTGFVSAEVIESQRKRRLSLTSCANCLTEGHMPDALFCRKCGERMVPPS